MTRLILALSLSMLACLAPALAPLPTSDVAKPSNIGAVYVSPKVESVNYAVCVPLTVNVRSGAGMQYEAIDTLPNGASVQVVGVAYDDFGYAWETVTYEAGDAVKTGSVYAKYICEAK